MIDIALGFAAVICIYMFLRQHKALRRVRRGEAVILDYELGIVERMCAGLARSGERDALRTVIDYAKAAAAGKTSEQVRAELPNTTARCVDCGIHVGRRRCDECAKTRARELEYDRQEELGVDQWRGLE